MSKNRFNKRVKKFLHNPSIIKGYVHEYWLKFIYGTSNPYWFYSAYRKYRSNKKYYDQKTLIHASDKKNRFLTIIPHQGAGIGHQLANWNAALILAQKFNLTFVHHYFNSQGWEEFLGFGMGEIKYEDVVRNKKIKIVNLPWIKSTDDQGFQLLNTIIHKVYPEENILFHLETNQNFFDQTQASETLRTKYFNYKKIKPAFCYFDSNRLNIAVHIRRGDIVAMKNNNEEGGKKRWVEYTYFLTILKTIYDCYDKQQIATHIYSQGNENDFADFSLLPGVVFHINDDVYSTFHHLVMADILVTSPSSFSYKAGLISKGIKIAQYPWWHHIPEDNEWIRSSAEGEFNKVSLLSKYTKFILA